MNSLGPTVLWSLGPLVLTDSLALSLAITVLLLGGGALAVRLEGPREVLEVIYELLERMIVDMVEVDPSKLIPLILTQWLFILVANLVGLLPGMTSPTGDLSVTAALAVVAFGAGHVYGFQAQGWAYLKQYVRPNPMLLPFNIIGELSRTLSLSLRLFGNMLSGKIIGAILLSLAGLLLPVPLMVLSVLTSVVQAYIFGVLTLVFTASAMQVAAPPPPPPAPEPSP